jgi:hypothetical protein
MDHTPFEEGLGRSQGQLGTLEKGRVRLSGHWSAGMPSDLCGTRFLCQLIMPLVSGAFTPLSFESMSNDGLLEQGQLPRH